MAERTAPSSGSQNWMHEGWLEKQGADFVGAFKRRYFVAYGDLLMYFDDVNKVNAGKHNGFIEMRCITDIWVANTLGPKGGASFTLVTPDREWVLRAENEKTMKEWIKFINHVKSVTAPASHSDSDGRPGQELWGTVGHLTSEQEKCLESLRRQLEQVSSSGKPPKDRLLLRLLRTNAFDVTKAQKMYHDIMEWRLTIKPHEITADQLHAGLVAKQVYVRVGVDKQARPTVLCRLSRYTPSLCPDEAVIKLVLYMVENVIAGLQGAHESFVILYDLTGYSKANSNLGLIRRLLELLQQRYPERIAAVYLYNAPMVFRGMWNIVKTWLHKSLIQRTKFIADRASLADVFTIDQLPEDLEGTFVIPPIG